MTVFPSSLNIVGVFQRYTHLSPASHSGKQWQGACPFSDCSADHRWVCGLAGADQSRDVTIIVAAVDVRAMCFPLSVPMKEYPDVEPVMRLVSPMMKWHLSTNWPFQRWPLTILRRMHGSNAQRHLHERRWSAYGVTKGFRRGTTCISEVSRMRPSSRRNWDTTKQRVLSQPLPGALQIVHRSKRSGCRVGSSFPGSLNSGLWKLNIRRGDKDIEHDIQQAKKNGRKPHAPKYIEVQGSASYLYHVDALVPGRPALLLESELDALAAIQAGTADIVSTVATGSIGRGHTPRALCALAQASRVLIGFDVDANGRGDDAAAWWLRTLPHATRLRPWVHDVNEMLQQQQDIRTWVSLGLEMPIQTVAIEMKEEQHSEDSEMYPISDARGRTISHL